MTHRSVVLHIDPPPSDSLSSDDHANPFESPRALSMADSIPKPAQAVLGSRQSSIPSATVRDHGHTRGDTASSQEQVLDEKQWQRHSQSRSIERAQHYDPEKATYSPRRSQPYISSNEALSVARSSDSDTTPLQQRKALRILLYLSGPCVLVSCLTTIWAILSLLVTILYQPFRLCTPRLPFHHQLCHLLAPTLNLHLRCIYAPVYPRPTEGDELYNSSWLLIVHLVAPFVSLGNAVAAWVVAVYWALAKMVGDPAGQDKKDDGMEAVLGLARWWECLLVKGVKDF